MRYAEEQVTRPQREDGCDFGTERRVLVRRGPDDLLHVPGHKIWAGRGERLYMESKIALYGPTIRETCHQEDIHEGRVVIGTWESLAAQIYAHLGQEFPVSLISLRATLLLDEPGEVDGPPVARSARREYPRIEDKVLFRCVADPGGTLRILAYTVEQQAHGRVTLLNTKSLSPSTRKVESLSKEGFANSPEGAADLLVQAGTRAMEDAFKSMEQVQIRCMVAIQDLAAIVVDSCRAVEAWHRTGGH